MSEHERPSSIRAFVVRVDSDEADVASDRLWQLGVRAVEERSPIDGGAGTELWTSVGQDDAAIARAVATLEPDWTWRVVDVATTYSETWREHVVPMWLTDDLVIVPEWIGTEAGTDLDEQADVDKGVTRVVIEPTGAFGLGDHPTSQLCARAVRSELARLGALGVTSPTVLDVGSGTGVLSIVAALSGASRVRAVDIAAEAVAATMSNAARNGVGDVIEVDGSLVAEITGPYDLVVANILAPVLVASADDLTRLVGRDGTLIISGILADAHRHVLAALAPLQPVDTTTQEGWAAVVLRPSDTDGMPAAANRLQAT